MNEAEQLNEDLRNIVTKFFAMNVHNLLAEPSRLEAVAQVAGIPPERVPAIRAVLTQANSVGLSS